MDSAQDVDEGRTFFIYPPQADLVQPRFGAVARAVLCDHVTARAAQTERLAEITLLRTKDKWQMAQTFMPGTETWYASDSPSNTFSAIFEDDRDTGYFYAYDRANQEKPILDAVHVYNVAAVRDKNVESAAEIIWSTDGLKAALLINRYPHAVINFTERCSYCRTGFPPPSNGWKRGTWSEQLMKLFESSA